MSRYNSVQQLRNDCYSLQAAVTELHTKLKLPPSVLNVPSWRYPERTASSIETVTSHCDDESHLTLMEHLVDRFLFILQSCVCEIDASNGRSHCSVPLSISSTIKRFVRGFIQQETRYSELEKTVEKLRKEIDTLHYSLHLTQEQCSLYKAAITSTNSVSTCCSSTSITLPTVNIPPSSSHLSCVDVCTQTTETSLSTCLECPQHLKVLKSLVKQVCALSNELSGNTTEEVSTDSNKLIESAHHHLSVIKDCIINAHKSNMTVKEELAVKQSLVSQLEEQSVMLRRNVSELQNKLKEKQVKYEEKLTLDQENHKVEIVKLKDKITSLLTQSSQLREDMVTLKKTENELRLNLTQKNQEMHNLKLLNEKSCAEKEQLDDLHKQLRTEICDMKKEHKEVCLKLEQKCLELNKTSTKLTNLENQCQSIKAKQKKLLEQVDDLDQKCSNLNVLLDESLAEKEDMKRKLLEMTETCKQTLKELEEEKEQLACSNKENENLKIKSLELEQEILAAQEWLKKELQKTKLLMEYPFSSVVPKPLSVNQSRDHINANTVRILLLEEQNDKLREQWTPSSLENKALQTSPTITEPVQLWQSIDPHVKSCSRAESTCRYRGRLGHLVDAITDSQSADLSETDSYTSPETHSCIDCDRLFCSLVDFHKHIQECNNS